MTTNNTAKNTTTKAVKAAQATNDAKALNIPTIEAFKADLGQVKDVKGALVAKLLGIAAKASQHGNNRYLTEVYTHVNGLPYVGALVSTYIMANSTGLKISDSGKITQIRKKGVTVKFAPSKNWPVTSWHRKPVSNKPQKEFKLEDSLMALLKKCHSKGIPMDAITEALKTVDVTEVYAKLDSKQSKKANRSKQTK